MTTFETFGFGFFENVFPIFFVVIFVIVIGVFIFAIARGVSQYSKNAASPILSVEASIVAKRINVSQHHGTGDNMHHHTSTSYYVTFQVESGDRIEFRIGGHEYGVLAEGDSGKLTFQGTRYLKFERGADI